MLEFAWKAYNKLNFDRNVKLSLPDRKCRRLKNNAENVTQKPKFYILRRRVLYPFADEKLTKA